MSKEHHHNFVDGKCIWCGLLVSHIEPQCNCVICKENRKIAAEGGVREWPSYTQARAEWGEMR